MAKLVQGKFDTFLADGSNEHDPKYVAHQSEIRFPHYIARLLVKQRDDSRRNGQGFNSVAWIKFVREWHQETYGKSLGLKDAKDIVDHYNTIGDKMNHDRPEHLQC